MGRHLNNLLYYKNLIIVAVLPIIFLPLPLIIKSSEALCGYLLLLMGGYWCTEALPLGVTSLIPVFLVPLFGFMTTKEVCPLYFKEINMMLTGGLIVALAVEKCNLHKRIALGVLLMIGVSPRWLMLGFMIPTWFLSMWISNTATSAMMMPIVIEVIYQIETVNHRNRKAKQIEMDNLAFQNHVDENENVSKLEDTEKELQVSVIKVNGSAVDAMQNMDGHGTTYELGEGGSSGGQEEGGEEEFVLNSSTASSISKGLVICIAYSANCGGTGTLIGTGVNLVCKGMADDLWQEKQGTDSPINFTTWIGWGFPISFLNLLVVWVWLQLYFVGPKQFFGCGAKRDMENEKTIKAVIQKEYQKLGRVTVAEIQVSVLFLILVLLWFFRQPDFMPGWASLFKKGFIADAVPAILIGVICFALPSNYPRNAGKGDKTDYLMDWDMMTAKFPWSVILLLGGGFALAEATTLSGLSAWIGNILTGLNALPNWVLVMLLTYLVTIVTQFTSNTATASLMLPIVKSMALNLKMNPLYLMLPVTVATQLAFMLPVATPPNAVAFSAGILEVMDMVKAGTVLNVMCTLVVTLATHTWGMALFSLNTFPFDTDAASNMTTIASMTTNLY